MFDMLKEWYSRRFSDPQAIALLAILLGGFCILYFFNGILAPVLVAVVLAYLLEWPTGCLQKIGLTRSLAVALVLLVFIALVLIFALILLPTAWQQGMNLIAEAPTMFNKFYLFAQTLPQRYPDLLDAGIIDIISSNVHAKIAEFGSSMVKMSLASLVGILTLAIYLILVPLIVFFLLKDKSQMLSAVKSVLPEDIGLAGKVWQEMNQQITNYIRGKVLEMVVVGIATYAVLAFCGLKYALLLSVFVGISVLIPYIGAVLVTMPVILVGLFQWGLGSEFWTMFIAYLVVQALDGNLLVPLLFSEVVNLHPLVIILSVIVFGGLWGFWGVFFAIPLATLVKAVMHALPNEKNIKVE